MSDLTSYNRLSTIFEQYLQTSIPELAPEVASLEEAMGYSLLSGGKRLRPLLLLSVIEANNQPIKAALPFAAAVELIHTYSLIHDDLPCMDNDELRRGKPTNHIVFGEAIALLAGDGLQSEAFRLMSAPERSLDYPGEIILKCIHCLSHKAGNFGMIAGQVADIKAEQSKGSIDLLEFIHHHKTGQLITAAIEIGSHLAGMEPTSIAHMISFGNALGHCFQIQDDILDQTGTESNLGKPIGSDQRNQKLTYPSLVGLKASHKLAEAAYHEAITQLHASGLPTESLISLADFVLKRDH